MCLEKLLMSHEDITITILSKNEVSIICALKSVILDYLGCIFLSSQVLSYSIIPDEEYAVIKVDVELRG